MFKAISFTLLLWSVVVSHMGGHYVVCFSRRDSHAKITLTVYNRMGMLLKSLASVARVTPSYRLARKQLSGDYVICYR
jgi:hypothetical protein